MNTTTTGPTQAFMCSACGAVSCNPNDVENQYCGRCHDVKPGCVIFAGQAAGALPNGTRVRKVNSEPGDGHPNGSLGTVLSSMAHEDVMGGRPFYFIEWDARPRIGVGTFSAKVEAAT